VCATRDAAGISPLRVNDIDLRRAMLGVFTATGTGGDGAGLERFLPPARTTLCGYGRQALTIGLHRLSITAGDVVLLPGFVCRELLGAVRRAGAEVRLYDVDDRFHAAIDSLDRIGGRHVRAVVAVNYFGFPQPLDDLSAWCRARGAVLIEDNAHGFLSADGDVPLGLRGDMGIFSIRKTLAVPNGGALVDNRPGQVWPPAGDLHFRDSPLATQVGWVLKRAVKSVIAAGGSSMIRPVVAAIRGARRMTTGSTTPAAPPDAEMEIPDTQIASVTARLLGRVAIENETARRRSLYGECERLLKDASGVRRLFAALPAGVVPQGFPFVYDGSAQEQRRFVQHWWRRYSVPIVGWPDLPSAVASTAPRHYRQVLLVPFLW
jgi:hypothetical protein